MAALSGEARAPWFFLWVQQMLKWGDPFLWGVFVPLMLLILLALIPYIFPKPADRELGRWFPRSSRLAQVTLVVIALLIIILTILGSLPVT
jgi:quinol-cytochrome oxidoreductase complex cytochrome b subunit